MKITIKYCRVLLLSIGLSGAWQLPLNAQDKQEKIHAFLEKVQQSYRNASYLGFHVNYRYANAGQLSKQLDTMSGEIEIDKDRSRFVIEGTETLITGKYGIHVSGEDKLIYLSKPGHTGVFDPITMLDSALIRGAGMQATIEPGTASGKQEGFHTLTLRFPPGNAYTLIQMTVNDKTGWLERISFDMHTAGVVGQEMINRQGHPAPYEQEGRVEILFSQYRKGGFGDEMFDEKKFFTRAGDRFIPAEAYKDYHIFLASSHL